MMIRRITPRGEPVLGYLNPYRIVLLYWRNRLLIRRMTWRDVVGRYRGSFIGMSWSLIHPLVMLGVYTFVFAVIFNARWGAGPGEGRAAFALALFTGLITFGVFAETVNSAPTLILSNANYVKKVVFPLEILPLVKLLAALINALFSVVVLLAGVLLVSGGLHWTVCLFPLVWLPMLLFTLGCACFLASLGVFIRDMGATVHILTTMLFFLTPIFYPIRLVPESFRWFLYLNPLAVFVENARRVVLWGQTPDWGLFTGFFLVSLLVWIAGFVWFMKSRNGFADVI